MKKLLFIMMCCLFMLGTYAQQNYLRKADFVKNKEQKEGVKKEVDKTTIQQNVTKADVPNKNGGILIKEQIVEQKKQFQNRSSTNRPLLNSKKPNNLAKAVIFSQDFEGSVSNVSFQGGDCPWAIGTNSEFGFGDYATTLNATTYAFIDDDDCNGDLSDAWLIISGIDLSAVSAPLLSFDAAWILDEGSSYSDIITIKASIDGGISWFDIQTLPENPEYLVTGGAGFDWTSLTMNLIGCENQSNVSIAFHFNDLGHWAYVCAVDNITIDEGCDFVTNLTPSLIDDDLTINWTIATTPDHYEISLNGTIVETAYSGSATSYVFNDLLNGLYNISVEPIFTSGCISSPTTINDYAIGTTCQWTIESWDYYGDGWNGGSLDVVQNGVTVATITNQNLDGITNNSSTGGEYNTHLINVFVGQIDFIWHSGYYDEEVGITIINQAQQPVFACAGNGTTPAPEVTDGATVFSTTNDCTIPSIDAAITAITAPVSGLNKTNAETVTITVTNYGSDPITSLPIELYVDGASSPITETLPCNISNLASQTLNLTNTVDLSADGLHTILVTAVLSGDANTSNDSKTITITNVVTPIAYSHDAYGYETYNDKYDYIDLLSGNATNISMIAATDLPLCEDIINGVIFRTDVNNNIHVVTDNGATISLGHISGISGDGIILGIAHDFDNDVVYLTTTDSKLYTLNLTTLTATSVATLTNVLIAFDYAADGFLYGPCSTDNILYKINPSNGVMTAVGTGIGITINYAQDVTYDKVTSRLYSFAYVSGTGSLFGYYDLSTGVFNTINTYANTEYTTFVSVREGTPCDQVTGLTPTVTGNDLEINWIIATAPDSYEISLNGTVVEASLAGTATSYDFGTLTNGVYNITITPMFSTSCIAIPTQLNNVIVGDYCNWTIVMSDIYDDGWDGNAHISIVQNGVEIGTARVESGQGANFAKTIPIFVGNVDFIWVAGTYDSECSFEIKDFSGITVYTSSGTPVAGTVFSTNNSCQLNAYDVAIIAITAPISGTNLTNAEQVTITVQNYGQNSITSMDISLVVDGGTAQTETWNGTIASLATQNITLTNTADLSAAISHTITVTAILAGDANATNDSQTINVVNTICDAKTLPFTENFDAITLSVPALPNCWSTIDANNDGYTWFTRASLGNTQYPEYDAHSEPNFATSQSWYNSNAITPDNYLITPQLIIPAEGASLTFWVGQSYNTGGAEHYSVMISTTGTNASDFTAVLTEDVAGLTWTQKTVDLANYGGQNIYIAWRHFACNDVEMLKIDDIAVTTLVSIEESITSNVSIYPNPSNGLVNIVVSEKSNINVYDVTGKLVDTFKINARETKVFSQSAGMYFVQVTDIKGNVTTERIVIE